PGLEQEVGAPLLQAEVEGHRAALPAQEVERERPVPGRSSGELLVEAPRVRGLRDRGPPGALPPRGLERKALLEPVLQRRAPLEALERERPTLRELPPPPPQVRLELGVERVLQRLHALGQREPRRALRLPAPHRQTAPARQLEEDLAGPTVGQVLQQQAIPAARRLEVLEQR